MQSSITVSHTSAQSVIDQGYTSAEKERLSTNSRMTDPSLVIAEFLNMKIQLQDLLQPYNPELIIKKCGSLLASDTHNIPLFTTDYIEQLQQVKDIPELIQKLSPLVTWDNHAILSTIADTSNVPEATMLLTQFDDGIDSSQPLTSFPIPEPSHHMIPYDSSTHTVLAVQLDLELYHCTLQNVLDARSLIQDQCKLTSYCLQLLATAKTNTTIIYWMMPRNVAYLITENALQFQKYYRQNGILLLTVYPGALLCTGSALKVGPLSFFSQIVIDNKLVKILWHKLKHLL